MPGGDDPRARLDFHRRGTGLELWKTRRSLSSFPQLETRPPPVEISESLNPEYVGVPPPGHRAQVADALGRDARVRGDGGSVAAEVLLPRDVRVPVRARARRSRAQLHDWRHHGAHQADARVQRPPPVRLGCVRPACGERGDQEQHAPGDLDVREHRPYERAAPASRHQLRLGPRDRDLPARVLPLEPVAVHAHVPARTGLPPALDGELVRELWDGARQRAGRRWRLLAVRHAGEHTRARPVVPSHHAVRRGAARRDRAARSLARQGPHDAAQLDRALGGRAGRFRAAARRARVGRARGRRAADRVHDPDRHDLRRHVRAHRARTSAGRTARGGVAGAGRLPAPGREIPGAGSDRAAHRRSGEGRIRYGPRGRQPLHRPTGPGLGRQFRARRVRHGGRHGRARARPARLRVRPQVRPADCRRRAAGRRAPGAGLDAGGIRGRGDPGRLRAVHRTPVG